MTTQDLLRWEDAKRAAVAKFLDAAALNVIRVDDEIRALAEAISQLGALAPADRQDCLHLAAAIARACDALVTWNFQDIANVRTLTAARTAAAHDHYRGIDIFVPGYLLN